MGSPIGRSVAGSRRTTLPAERSANPDGEPADVDASDRVGRGIDPQHFARVRRCNPEVPLAGRQPQRRPTRETNGWERRQRGDVEAKQSARPDLERPEGVADLHDISDRPVELACDGVVQVRFAQREHGAAAPIEGDEPTRAESVVAHGLDRGNQPLSEVRERGDFSIQVHGLRGRARGEIEAKERPVGDRPSRIAAQCDPERVRAGGNRAGVPRHRQRGGHSPRRHVLIGVACRKQHGAGDRSDDRGRDDGDPKPAAPRIPRRRHGSVHAVDDPTAGRGFQPGRASPGKTLSCCGISVRRLQRGEAGADRRRP